MSRDRSATIRFSRRAEHFKSFSIAISTQSNYFDVVIILIRKCCQQTTPRYCSIDQLPHGLYGAIGTLHRTEQNHTCRSRDIARPVSIKKKVRDLRKADI